MPHNESIDLDLGNLSAVLERLQPDPDRRARVQTRFYRVLSEAAHRFYGGKIQTAPRCGLYGPAWLNAWYTPGVSSVSTAIRDHNDASFELSGRGNTVAVVSDSTRVLGDGDVTPPGGLGVMEGKAFLMKYLGGVDAVPLCVNDRDERGRPDPERLIQFVKMASPSFGAVNLEDISQPQCFRVLDALRDSAGIAVWHDDAQGTACVTLAGLRNALDLAGKRLADARIVLLGAGAANTTIARLLMADGADPARLSLFDRKGGIHAGRADLEADPDAYRQWELALATNPERFKLPEDALKGADALIALSSPGPDTVKRPWVRSMGPKAVVFACANPVPEIWPHAAKEEGAYIVATGRGDFPNQVNNSVCFPGILKGALLVRAKAISDSMALRCAHALADFARNRPEGITPESILPTMDDDGLFELEAAEVADQAVAEGLARVPLGRDQAYARARADIHASRELFRVVLATLPEPPASMLADALSTALSEA
ncbi:MAG: NADP-dependent malic enzyme [Spirochaetales bacterium]|nr:NADP-dependent malic enzyme [Spirochaetales bacterium]